MIPQKIQIILESAATFGRGDGVPGLVDQEIEHDRYGFPYLRGRTLKGLLRESAYDVTYALQLQGQSEWAEVHAWLFGQPGRGLDEQGVLHIGDACLPEALRAWVLAENARKPERFTAQDVLFSLTGVRHQTAINPAGAPEYGSLRSMRVLLRGVILEAPLTFDLPPEEEHLALLAAATLAFRNAGTSRNRGRGHLKAELDDETTTRSLFEIFAKAVKP